MSTKAVPLREQRATAVLFELGRQARYARDWHAGTDEACALVEDLLALHGDDQTEVAKQLYGTETPTTEELAIVSDLVDGCRELRAIANAFEGLATEASANRKALLRKIALR